MKKIFLSSFLLLTVFSVLSACAPLPRQAGAPVRTDTQPAGTAPVTSPATPSAPRRNQTNVGFLVPLTGSNAAVGESLSQAAQLAIFETGDPNFNLLIRDTQGTENGTREAVRSAVNDGAQLLIGPLFANNVRTAQPLARQAGLNMIAFSTDWTLANDDTYLIGFLPFSQVNRIADYAIAREQLRRFAIIAPRSQYGDVAAERFRSRINQKGGNIVSEIRYVPNDPELGSRISRISKDVDAVFIPAAGPELLAIADYLEQNGMSSRQVQYLGTGLWDSPDLARSPKLAGGLYAAPSPQDRQYFENLYRSTYGEDPVRIATLGLDAVALAVTLSQNRPNRPYTDSALQSRSGFSGSDGIFRFNRDGTVERTLAVSTFENGRIREIDQSRTQF